MEYEDPDLQEPSALAAARRTRKYLRRSTNVAVHGPRLLRVQAAAGGHEARVGRWPERCCFLVPGSYDKTALAPPPERSNWLCKTKARYLGPAFVQAQPQVPCKSNHTRSKISHALSDTVHHMHSHGDDSPRRYYLLIFKAKICMQLRRTQRVRSTMCACLSHANTQLLDEHSYLLVPTGTKRA